MQHLRPLVILSTAALLACEDQSQEFPSGTEGVVTISQLALATTNDITVGYIQRRPVMDWVEASSNPTVEGWPAVGSVVTWRGFVRNFGPARTGVQVRWFVDDIPVLTGTTALPANGTAEVNLSRPWDFARHAIRLEIDGNNAVAEEEEGNNSLTVDSDAISVGFWVEQSLYNYFRDRQRDLGIGSSSWDNWAQRHIIRANRMFAAALSPDNPAGAVDRWRLDKITIVADGALPLTGCCYATNNPDSNDRTTDLQWGFPASLLTGDMYQDTTTVGDQNPFYYEGSLLHELGHARYLVDLYTWNVHSDPGNNSVRIPISEGGSNIVGTKFLPMVRNDVVYYSHQFGLMNGPFTYLDHYSASALNLIAGRRATLGNQNAPGNFAVFMNDLPSENRLTLLDNATGTPLAGATVSVHQVFEELYGSTPAFTRTADSAGRVLLGRNPFTPGQVTEGSNVMLLRVAHTNRVRYQFVESTDFNREYWRGHTAQGEYTMRVDFRAFPNRLTFAPSADAAVREASPASNFGTATTLDVINSPGASRWIYLRFPITGATGEITALLRLHGSRPVESDIADRVFSVSSNTWSETGITWNNRPATAVGESGEVKVGTAAGYWDLDVTGPVQEAINAGASTINLAVKMKDSMTGSPDSFASREGPAATRPQLIVAPQDLQPTVAAPAAASPSTVTGTTTDLSVLGSDDSGEPGLTYQWSVIDSPPVSFSRNDSNAAKNTTATFQAGGPHHIRVTIVDGLGHTVDSVVTVNVNPPITSVLPPLADAYVRDGTNAGVNFGGLAGLEVKAQSTAGNTRWSYLRFSLSAVSGTVTSAKLRLHGSRPSAGPATDSAFAVSSNSWTETGITWNNRPPLGAAQGRGLVIGAPTFANYYVWDVTPFVKAQKQAGASEVSLAIRMDSNVTIAPDTFNSREAASNRPELVVTAMGGGGCGSAPTVATPAAASPNPVTGTSTALSVLGADDGGEPALRYAWSTVGTPPAPVTFSPNLTNAAKNSTATFTQPGSYDLRVTITDACGQAAISTVTVTVNGDSTTTTKLNPTADAHVRDGTSANTSFGTATALEQKNSTVTGNNRRTFLRFAIGSLGSNITAAKLRLHGASVTSAKLTGVYAVSNVTWAETVTWNTAPMIGAKLGTSKTVGTTATYVEWDVTGYLQGQKAAGATAVSLEMKQDTANNEAPTSWSSRQAASNRPELEVTTSP